MATKKLTPNNTDLLTGFANPVIGWHFTADTALDVFEGARTIQWAGWTWDIHPSPDNPGYQRMTITPVDQQPNTVPIFVDNGQWFCLDGKFIVILDGADVAAHYTVEPYTLPSQR